jgi:ubiquinone/menaquinone biosynthesis C-methylase UbiE
MYFDEKAINPKVILDVGSGTGGSAFVLGELFPEATVTGIDMAPTYIRFSRAHKDLRNATNVEFYQANAEDMSSFLEDNSVDFINFAYVLHEMPAVNAKRIVNEMFRVLKPGGQLNGFDVPYKTNSLVRDYFVSTNTWDEDWNVQVRTMRDT